MSSTVALAALIWAEIQTSTYKQAEVCRELDISQKHLSRVVNGRTGMSLELADRLLGVVGRELVLSTRVKMEATS